MKEIALRQWNFAIIPKIHTECFVRRVLEWYEFVTEDVIYGKTVPDFANDMMYNCRNTQESFSQYIYTITQFEYVRHYFPSYFHPEVFPADVPVELWQEHDDNWTEYLSNMAQPHEYCLFNDMKRVLNTYKMFYVDKYNYDLDGFSTGKKTSYHNIPIKGVW